jgi:replication-associated recombination protein RarA
MIALCEEYRFDADVALFFDEIHHLHERHSQEPLLKFVEDSPGLIMAAVMADRYEELIPPLRERFKTIWLVPATEDEMVAFFDRKCRDREWSILAREASIRAMVRESGLSFRYCLRKLAEAASRDPRSLDRLLLEDDPLSGNGPPDESPNSGSDGSTDRRDQSEDDELFSG